MTHRQDPRGVRKHHATALSSGLVLAAGLALFLSSACGGSFEAENTAAACSDGLDNDGDFAIDCDDLDCAPFGFCMQTCGDGVCDASETAATCPADCGAGGEVCTNGIDDDGDMLADCLDPDCSTDPACSGSCGDGVCDAGAGEACDVCVADCGACGPICGDGTCDVGEDCMGCAADCGPCGPSCGDGTCDAGEDCASCAGDCGACPPPPETFGVTLVPESYVVPAGITSVRIEAFGASGGDAAGAAGTLFGGYGVLVDTVVTVSPGEVLTVNVGEQPALQVFGDNGCGASGGGGTFVRSGGSSLAVAGGGGGASGTNLGGLTTDGGDAMVGTSGGSSGIHAGGTGSFGGEGADLCGGPSGGGGGGLSGDGGDPTCGGGATGGNGYPNLNGGLRDGSANCGTAASGGYGGGGGGGSWTGGGGGGYSGGAAADGLPPIGTLAPSGGGGSFAAGTSPSITVRTSHGHGSVTITPL